MDKTFCDDCGDPLQTGDFYHFHRFPKATANTYAGEAAFLCPKCFQTLIGNEDVVGELLDLIKRLMGKDREVVAHGAKEIMARRAELAKAKATETLGIDLQNSNGVLNISFGISKELLDKQFDVVYDIVMQILSDYRDGKRHYFK